MLRKTIASLFLASIVSAAHAEPKVVVSIKPIHSIVSSIMKGVGQPTLLMEGTQSPHTARLKPGQAQSLQDAGLVVWVGPELEQFLAKPISSITNNATVIELGKLVEEHSENHGGEHGHGDDENHKDEHEHDKEAEHHDEHDHDKEAKHEDEHDHDKHAKHDDEHDHDKDTKHEDEHGHEGHDHADVHVWLDPESMHDVVQPIAKQLAKVDPENKQKYEKNAKNLMAEIDALNDSIKEKLANIRKKPFLAYHDAYKPFVSHYGLNNPASIAVDEDRKPSAAHIRKLQEMVTAQKITCIFSEPQFDGDWLSSIWPTPPMKYAVLDPLGSSIPAGTAQYSTMINALADSLVGCLSDG